MVATSSNTRNLTNHKPGCNQHQCAANSRPQDLWLRLPHPTAGCNRGASQPQIRLFDFGDFINKLRTETVRKSSERGIGLEVQISAEGYCVVNGDAGLLRDVLEFLLANAMNTNEKGSVRFAVSRADDDVYVFEVRDRGAVYSDVELAHIFEPFHKNEGERIKGATGLGLAIASKRIAAMGGDLKITSEVGEGCIFSFEIQFPTSGAANVAANISANS